MEKITTFQTPMNAEHQKVVKRINEMPDAKKREIRDGVTRERMETFKEIKDKGLSKEAGDFWEKRMEDVEPNAKGVPQKNLSMMKFKKILHRESIEGLEKIPEVKKRKMQTDGVSKEELKQIFSESGHTVDDEEIETFYSDLMEVPVKKIPEEKLRAIDEQHGSGGRSSMASTNPPGGGEGVMDGGIADSSDRGKENWKKLKRAVSKNPNKTLPIVKKIAALPADKKEKLKTSGMQKQEFKSLFAPEEQEAAELFYTQDMDPIEKKLPENKRKKLEKIAKENSKMDPERRRRVMDKIKNMSDEDKEKLRNGAQKDDVVELFPGKEGEAEDFFDDIMSLRAFVSIQATPIQTQPPPTVPVTTDWVCLYRCRVYRFKDP